MPLVFFTIQDMEQEGNRMYIRKNVKKTGEEEGWGGDKEIICSLI